MEPNPRKVQRLKLSGDFRSVREKGSSVTGKWLVLGVLRPQPPETAGTDSTAGTDKRPLLGAKLGIITSKKVGGAVVRNRVRRQLRHIQQSFYPNLSRSVWCVTVARYSASRATFSQLRAEWERLASKAGIFSA
jgi:ribonuclease P protein component